jgi:hypothetical protein
MSAPPSEVLQAVALQLVEALEQYGEDSERMVEGWPDLELYRCVSDQVEAIRQYSSALPEVRVQWVELLIAHAELIHFLWRLKYGESKDVQAQIESVRQHHVDCIAALRRRTERFLHHGAGWRAGTASPPRG